MKLLFVMLFLLIGGLASGQSNNFALIDKYVLSVQDTSVEMLAKKLTKPYKTGKEKVRAIFKWVTNNIAYDYAGKLAGDTVYRDVLAQARRQVDAELHDTFRYNFQYDREYKRLFDPTYNLLIVKKVIREKKGICDGYSRLFKTLCDYANVQCEIIIGRARHWNYEADGGSNHAWNAVMIDGKWQLLDATWGAGHVDSSSTFSRRYEDFYFLTPPGALINTHFPDDAKWMLLDEKPHLYQVYNTVYTYPSFYKYKIRSITPVERTIVITPANRKVTFELELPPGTVPKHVSVYEQPALLSGNTEIKVVGSKVICVYEVESVESEGLFIYYGSRAVLAYKIKVKK